jgi:hypothetical protein
MSSAHHVHFLKPYSLSLFFLFYLHSWLWEKSREGLKENLSWLQIFFALDLVLKWRGYTEVQWRLPIVHSLRLLSPAELSQGRLGFRWGWVWWLNPLTSLISSSKEKWLSMVAIRGWCSNHAAGTLFNNKWSTLNFRINKMTWLCGGGATGILDLKGILLWIFFF